MQYLGEFGVLGLILALALALLQIIYPLWGARCNKPRLMAASKVLALGQFFFISLSFLSLCYAFATNDFTLAYVAAHSNTDLPIAFRISAVWGAHEGSLLLWGLILSGWGAAVALFSKRLPLEVLARVLAVMAMISVGFYAFILFTSNPFVLTLPNIPVNGRDLNPLLQDIALVLHPPMLYMGYVGFSVAFAFAIAALMQGRLDASWACWSRPWTVAAWVFLTLGIALGSWWAYYELGWGGWWFWDPVENASLMPWLVGTALLHSLAASYKRGVFKAWTVLLAIAAFAFSLLGTFLVRSGILVSVHSFASDPARGLYILGFLLAVIGGSLVLFALKAPRIKSRGSFELFSRESFLFLNNLFLMAALLIVLLGTLLPLVHKELGMGSISIGEAFFNRAFTCLMLPFSVALGLGPLMRWKRQQLGQITRPLLLCAVFTGISAPLFIVMFAEQFKLLALLGLSMGLWIVFCTLTELYIRASHQQDLFKGLRKLALSHWAMSVAHLGLAITVIGISMTQNYSIEKDLRMEKGQSLEFAAHHFSFIDVKSIDGANYDAEQAIIEVKKGQNVVAVLKPEKRWYRVQGMPMTEAGIDAGFTRDFYAAMGELLPDGAWPIRLHYKPFIRWIWLGALIMACGGLLAFADKRLLLSHLPKPLT